ncbi:hypothetical protein [Asaia bogorensis]|uniref:hypothetical protein n=1 Tax=Asaia bogorensis TaxID=91915 RepID=UPI000EFB3A78|nr:hypothetical protein [Asaia bogorensis]
MTDRGILFNASMVRAILDGRKTQTRRVMKAQPAAYAGGVHPNHHQKHPHPYIDAYCGGRITRENPRGMTLDWNWWSEDDRCGPYIGKAPCVPGDRFWVRETWGINDYRYCRPAPIPKKKPTDISADAVVYFATEADPEILAEMPRAPSLFMPRWASRLTLAVTDIRAHKLHEISEQDAIAEGCPDPSYQSGDPRGWFEQIWREISGVDAWAENPWVWAITFAVEHGNIDMETLRC